jgi:ATP-dependent Lon protease
MSNTTKRVKEIPEEMYQNMSIEWVSDVDEVLKKALESHAGSELQSA